jgi:hypothetical protein
MKYFLRAAIKGAQIRICSLGRKWGYATLFENLTQNKSFLS